MNESPYISSIDSGPPITTTADLLLIRKKIKFWFIGIWISIATIVIFPMIGLLVTVIGMRGAFSDLGPSGIEDPEQLSAHIGEVLIATSVGLVFSIIGFIPLIISIVQHCKWKRRLKV